MFYYFIDSFHLKKHLCNYVKYRFCADICNVTLKYFEILQYLTQIISYKNSMDVDFMLILDISDMVLIRKFDAFSHHYTYDSH